MKLIYNERIIWESKNKQLLLTTHRLRELNKSFIGSSIKSIMLAEITACELRTIRQYKYLRKAFIYFTLINLAVYLLNNFLFNSELIILFLGDVHIGPETAEIVFYFSIATAIVYIVSFFLSVKKVFSFYSNNLTIDFQIRWLDFEERESFISKVEEAKDNRAQTLFGN